MVHVHVIKCVHVHVHAQAYTCIDLSNEVAHCCAGSYLFTWCLVRLLPVVVMAAVCLWLVCSTCGKGRKHCKPQMAANAKSVRRCRMSCAVRCAHVAAGCASCSDDGWLCACLQLCWKGKGALQARDRCKCNPVPSCTAAQMSFVAHEFCRMVLFLQDDGWLCACVQSLLKGKDALQAKAGSMQPCVILAAGQMSFAPQMSCC